MYIHILLMHIYMYDVYHVCHWFLWVDVTWTSFVVPTVKAYLFAFCPLCRHWILNSMLCNDGWTTRPCSGNWTYSWISFFFHWKYQEKCSSSINKGWFPYCACCRYVKQVIPIILPNVFWRAHKKRILIERARIRSRSSTNLLEHDKNHLQ